MLRALSVAMTAVVLIVVAPRSQTPDRRPGTMLASMTWVEAQAKLTSATVVVLPIGSAATEHGPHLRLDTDERLVRHLAARVGASATVVVAPPLTYHFHPGWFDYPGSISLGVNTARDLTVDVVRSLAHYGPRRFYALPVSVSTSRALSAAARILADDGVLLQFLDVPAQLPSRPRQPRYGSPGDEAETSMMLAIDPAAVDMTKAVRELGAGSGRLARTANLPDTIYSASGVFGDPTQASAASGRTLIDAFVNTALRDIDRLSKTALPAVNGRSSPPAPAPAGPRITQPAVMPNGCLDGDDRAVRQIGEKFSTLWHQLDANGIADLFAPKGDIRHPDGTIERGHETILVNRQQLFMKREYHDSRYQVSLNDIRCVGNDLALADGKWELRAVKDEKGKDSSQAGFCSILARRSGTQWLIEAWRYTITPAVETGPILLKVPGPTGGRGGE